MKNTLVGDIEDKRQDAENIIIDLLKKMPEERKKEVLRFVEGFALSEMTNKKTG